MPALLHHAVFTDLHFMCNCNSVSLGMRDDGLVQSTPSVAIPRCGLRVMPWHPPEGTPSHPPRRVRTAGHPIYRPALPYLSAWGNRSSSVFGCPSVSRFGRGDTASANSCRAAGPECRRKLLMGRNRAWCSWDGRIVCLAVVSRNLGYQFSLLWR